MWRSIMQVDNQESLVMRHIQQEQIKQIHVEREGVDAQRRLEDLAMPSVKKDTIKLTRFAQEEMKQKRKANVSRGLLAAEQQQGDLPEFRFHSVQKQRNREKERVAEYAQNIEDRVSFFHSTAPSSDPKKAKVTYAKNIGIGLEVRV